MIKTIDALLAQIESCITEQRYEPIESDKVELKDLSGGISDELYKSVCAFLNSDGGIVIIGIHEDPQHQQYTVRGYNPTLENHLRGLEKKFTGINQQPINLEFSFPSLETRDFMGRQVCIVYVEKLSEEKKYAFYKNVAYRRRLTSDERLTDSEIQRHQELKTELESARELQIVEQTSLANLDVDKLNDFIVRLNRDVRVESLKADIDGARAFLTRKHFIRDSQPTLLGMLVCGANVEDHLGGRCQVDGYVESPVQIAENKQVLKDNVFALMERSVGFVYKNIQVGVSHIKGGSDVPEYPDKLIRETVNNALAHRDYAVNQFVVISIRPNTSIEIRNPGSFRQEQLLRFDDRGDKIRARRVIPLPRARNPRLADILKTFDRWEGRGIGMASLTNAALNNQIGVPYYIFHSQNDVSLFIPKGRTLDSQMELWLKSYSGYLREKTHGRELTEAEKTVLAYFYQSEKLNRLERHTILLTADNNHFEVIAQLDDLGLIYKHSQSPDIYPVYLVDRSLTQVDFNDALQKLFGSEYAQLKEEYQKVLQAIFLHTTFSSEKTLSARAAGEFLYLQEHTKITDVRSFEDYKRRVRNIFNRLEARGFIVRQDGNKPQFIINSAFQSQNTLL